MSHSSQKHRLRWFFIKLSFFVIPLLLGLLALLGSAVIVGEAMPPALVFTIPSGTPGFYEPTWGRKDEIAYKFQGAVLRRPEILLIGSSRGLYVRSPMFTRQPDAFFNAAFSAATVFELRQFVEALAARDAMPPILLLQLDLTDFNADAVGWRNGDTLVFSETLWLDNLDQMLTGTRTVGREWARNPQRVLRILQHNLGEGWPRYGRTYWTRGFTFYFDGSRLNRRLSQQAINAGRAEHASQLERRTSRYTAGYTVDQDAVGDVQRILELAAEHGTRVIGYLPPYQQTIYQEMISSGDFAFIPLATEQLAATFGGAGFPFYDYSDVRRVGGNDEELYDGWHGGEKLQMRIVYTLALAEPGLLGAYVDAPALMEQIALVENPFYFYVEQR